MAEFFLGELWQSDKSEEQRNYFNLFSECFRRISTLCFLWLTRNATFRKKRNPHRFLYKEHFHKHNINLPEKRNPHRFLYKEHFHKHNINHPEK